MVEAMIKEKTDILELFASARRRQTYVKVAAPMVRYSKLEFRTLLRRNKVDLCFTPMIIADSFCQSDLARRNEFTTARNDSPLVVQFAAKDSVDLLTGAELVFPYCDGIDLNCGCPQRWAVASGYGCAALKKPELLRDMIQTVRRNLPGRFTVSLKMRLLQKDDIRTTVDLCRQVERCGVSFVTVHGRTAWQKTCEPVDVNAIGEIKKSIAIPVIGNGDVRTLNDADAMYSATGSDGVMSARGLLSNPSLFTGTAATTKECIRDWVGLDRGDRIGFQCFHHHLTFMMARYMQRRLRVVFNNFTTKRQVLEFLERELDVVDCGAAPVLGDNFKCIYDGELYRTRKESTAPASDNHRELSNGKYFDEFNATHDELSFMGASLFDEAQPKTTL